MAQIIYDYRREFRSIRVLVIRCSLLIGLGQALIALEIFLCR